MKNFIRNNWVDVAALALYVLIMLMLTTSCNRKLTPQVIERTDTVKVQSVVERVRDTTIWIESDSSESMWLIDCEGENARLKQILAYNSGSRVKPPTVYLKNNILTAKCKEDSLIMVLQLKDKTITELTKINNEKQTVVTEYKTNGFVKVLAWVGGISLVLIVLVVVWKVAKWKLPFKL